MTSLPEIQSFLKYLFQVCLVYITGLIVWVWCNRNPDEGLNAVQQTDRVALKSGTRSSSMVMAGHSSSHSGHNDAKAFLKSNNLHYNTLGRWVNGINDSSTKCLMFQALFFS
jgi:hypothetical protein